jgi:hypothetical protein
MLTKDMKELIRLFNEHGVEYLLVGGYAYGVHAQPRATKDLDLFIRANASNGDAVFRALCKFGAPLHGLTAKDFRDAKTGFQIGLPPSRIDIHQQISARLSGQVRQPGWDRWFCWLSQYGKRKLFTHRSSDPF